ncbi:MAG: hypothetical protein RMM30_01645 [Armatimonadota bacterium]|nr:hypothetical protein [Armatimonadota bacterium]MDW8155277.1 hypothetical protein [Armatimonadota bacterium]
MTDSPVAVVGLQATGLVVASCLAGPHRPVVAVEPDRLRRGLLQQGRLPFFEPGLEPLFREAVGCGWLEVADQLPTRGRLVCLGEDPQGAPWLEALLTRVTPGAVLVVQAAVPVGTADALRAQLRRLRGDGFSAVVVSNPLLLRRGQAVRDFLRPRWVVLGGDERWAVDAVAQLYRGSGAVLVRTDHRTAEAVGRVADALPGAFGSLLQAAREASEAWGVDFELLRRLVLTEVTEGAFRRYVHHLGRGGANGGPDLARTTRTPAGAL